MFWYFSDFKRKTFGTLAKSFWLRSLSCILHIQRKFLGVFFEFGWPILSRWDFFKKISDVFSKLLFMPPREYSFFFKKFKHFPSYSDLELNFFGLLAAKSWKFGQTTVRCAQRNFLRKTLFYEEKTLYSFSNIEPNMFENWQFFLLRSINCKLRDQRSFFGKFPWGSSSYFIYFGILAKTIRSVCRNCLLWALRIVLKDKGFFSKKLSLFFGFGSNISWIFSEKFLVGWPICRWKSPGEHFENNVFFFEKNLLFQTLRQKRSEKG